MEELFATVAALVRDTPPLVATNDEKLQLYGLYKHIVDGPCPGDTLPSIFQAVARAKYLAWEECQCYSKQEAMREYIRLMTAREDDLGARCQELWQNFKMQKSGNQGEESKTTSKERPPETMKSQSSRFKEPRNYSILQGTQLLVTSWMTYLFGLIGVCPMIPRGRLDISFSDLFFALYQCCSHLWRRDEERRCNQLQDQIVTLWNTAETNSSEAIVGFSVRSLFDLYLCTKKYPKQSEVIVFPPISVPGMMQVANYHNLNLVGVDILDSKDWWNFNGIQQAIYDQKTVAIMIVHPFGMLTVSEEQMRQIRRLADDHNLEVWEDCAECFTGLNNSAYLGSKDVADVRFFSFGMIKTATALGCGVAILRNTAVVRHMERLQQSLCKRQSTLEFFKRVSLSLILNFMSGSPLLFGMLVSLSSICGFNYDKIVTSSIRGFPTMPSSKRYSHSEASYYRLLQSHIRSQIRKRPCPALLALFLRRLQQQSILSSSIAQRIKRCQQLDASLRKDLPESILLPNNNENTYWAFPIFCDNPSSTSQQLQTRGFDAVRWASQLCCIAGKTKEDGNSCQKTQALMNSVLYLPISSQTLSPESTRKLADFLRRCLTKSSSDNDTNVSKAFFQLKWNVLAGLYMAWLTMVWKSMGFTNMLTTFIWSGTSIAWFLGITAVILICSQHVLRLGVSSLYLNHAHWFKHFDMVNAATTDEVIHTDTTTSGKQNILSEMETLRLPYILLDDTDHGTSGRKVLLTGATGFVGSLLLRDLLLHRKQLSIMGGIIVISRGKGKKSAKARIDALLAKPMFEFLSDVEKRDLVHTIEGDVTKASLGLSNNDFSCIVQDTSISHVFHSAAAVSFTQDLPDAARSNITSTLGMQSLTAQLKSKDVQFVHISTAFVHGDRTGTFLSPLTEKVFSLGPFDPAEIYKSMLSTEFYATKAMTELGFPNTYAFSKCVCEHLLLQRNDANTLIIRPSIVGPAVESPFEGWAGGKPSTLVAASMLYLSLPWNIWHLPPAAVAYIPVDVLCRFVLSKAFSAIPNTLDANSQESSSSGSSFQEIGRMSDSSSDSGEIVSMASSTKNSHRIFNATWDNKSNGNAIFTWLDFGVAQCHLAVITGCVTRPTAMCALYVCAVLMPKLSPNAPLFQQMHSLFVLGPISILVKILDRIKLSQPGLAKIVPFLDLPLLFFPFVKASFHFQSDLTAPNSFDAKRYAFGCGVAANRFLSSIRSNSRDRDSKGVPQSERDLQPTLSMLPIGGEIHKIGTTDFWWAISQPIGSYPIRLAAYIFTKILRAVSLLVTVDVVSFQNTYSSIQRRDGITTCIVLAPTHRSFFDFILLSYVVFSIPELQLDIPYIVAADEFEQLPLIGIIARLLRAFYVQRGKGCPDKDLSLNLASLKEKKLSWPSGCLEVFIEGKRSRDRRFVSPKTGLLKSLKESGGDHVIVPICINYEVIPEQKQLSAEASGSPRGNLNVIGMVKWLMVSLILLRII
jgi:dTDP-4-amino-4,6-dideoxygalactose transaminase/nucleoside-diphosphate-sugar epimerase/acyl-CoA-binding protein/1-acyl-sn-glycerol-3-phosphate acyltransferase